MAGCQGKKMLQTIKLLTLTLITSATTLGFVQAEAIAWRTDLRAAQAEAEQTGKLVLIHFYTDSCGPCRMLDKNVFSMPNVATALEANYVPVKLNANQAADISKAYGVSRVPTDVVTDAAGKQVKRLVSPATPMAYIGTMTNLAGQHRSMVGTYDQIARNAPSPSAIQTGTNGLNPAYASPSYNGPSYDSLAANSPVMAPAPAASPYSQPKPSVVGNRYAMAPTTQPSSTMGTAGTGSNLAQPFANQSNGIPAAATRSKPSLENPYYGTQASPVAPMAPTNQPQTGQLQTGQLQAMAQAAPPAAENVASIPKVEAPITPIVENPTLNNTATPKQVAVTPAVQLPAGSPPLGFDGYCAVTMKDKWQWVKGDTKWGAIHRGRTYLFTDEASRDKFLAGPDMYSPALSGSDPVLAVDSRQSIPGTRQYALEYEGKFYFFSSEQTLNKFWTNADGYAKGSERVAAAIQADGKIIR